MGNKKTLIIIAGPTASGKTELAIRLARHFSTVVLSADSRQFFSEMMIGTARPDEKEMQGIRHYFLGHLSTEEDYSAARFSEDASTLLIDLFSKLDTVIVTGGSGLYIQALTEGMDEMPHVPEEHREYLNKLFADKGIHELQKMLKDADPQYYLEVDQNNPQRLIRALEVYLATGLPYSSFRTGKKRKLPWELIKIGLAWPKEKLHERIDARVDRMMERGLLEEVKSLVKKKNLNALNTVGYQELFDHLEQKISLDEAVERIRKNTRKLAKRQMTWFKKDKEITWFYSDNPEPVFEWLRSHVAVE